MRFGPPVRFRGVLLFFGCFFKDVGRFQHSVNVKAFLVEVSSARFDTCRVHIEWRGRIQKPKVHCLTSIHWAFDITTITRTSQVEIVVELFGLLHILLGLTIPKSVPITPIS